MLKVTTTSSSNVIRVVAAGPKPTTNTGFSAPTTTNTTARSR